MPTVKIKVNGKTIEKNIRDIGHLRAQIAFPHSVVKSKKVYSRKTKPGRSEEWLMVYIATKYQKLHT